MAIQEATLNREATPVLVIRAEAIQAEAIQAVATLNKVDILALTPELVTLNQEVVIPVVVIPEVVIPEVVIPEVIKNH